jgi:hypothetical protein
MATAKAATNVIFPAPLRAPADSAAASARVDSPLIRIPAEVELVFRHERKIRFRAD